MELAGNFHSTCWISRIGCHIAFASLCDGKPACAPQVEEKKSKYVPLKILQRARSEASEGPARLLPATIEVSHATYLSGDNCMRCIVAFQQ